MSAMALQVDDFNDTFLIEEVEAPALATVLILP